MPPVTESILLLLRRQAQQSVLQTRSSLVIRSSFRQPLQQQRRTILSQQYPPGSLRRQAQGFSKRPFNRTKQQQRFSSSSSSSSSSSTNAAQRSQTTQAAKSFSERMKDLSREYGWAAVGVYFGLSALDFPICFVAVRLFGAERIGHYEHLVFGEIKKWFYSIVPLDGYNAGLVKEGGVDQVDGSHEHEHGHEHGLAVAADEVPTNETASIWTQLAIAYAVHKSLIFIRVPLTAAVTPRVVKTLRSWGWSIGKKSSKAT